MVTQVDGTRKADYKALIEHTGRVMDKYGLQSVTLTAISGYSGEKPYSRLRIVNEGGQSETYRKDWEVS